MNRSVNSITHSFWHVPTQIVLAFLFIAIAGPALSQPTNTQLSPDGPWWLFVTGEGIWADGLWAINPDGSGLTQLTNELIITPRALLAAVSPSGGHVAFITAADRQFRGLTLKLMTLPDGRIETLTPLTSAATEPVPDIDPALRPDEPLLAITQEASMAWSPDGKYLAFMGAHQGPSSDLYVYSLEDGSITRLTDGPSQAIRPSWSTDSEYIVHLGINTLGTGAGYSMTGVWAARVDGLGVNTLFSPVQLGDERVIGWLDNHTMVVYTVDVIAGGNVNLRTVNVETGEQHLRWDGFFSSVALNLATGSLLLAVDSVAAQGNPDGQTGLFFIGSANTPALRILEDDSYEVSWAAQGSTEAGLFFAHTEFGLLAVSSIGDSIEIAEPITRIPIMDPDGQQLAWFGLDGLWVGPLLDSIEQTPQQVFTNSVGLATWGPSGQQLLFGSEGALYVAQNPMFEPVLVTEGLNILTAAWVWP